MKDLKSALLLLFFPRQAEGSPVVDGLGRVLSSSLIDQPFSEAKYFWPRPFTTADLPYNPLLSAGKVLL